MNIGFGFCVGWASLCLMFVSIFVGRSMDAKFFAGILKIKLNEAEDKLKAVREITDPYANHEHIDIDTNPSLLACVRISKQIEAAIWHAGKVPR